MKRLLDSFVWLLGAAMLSIVAASVLASVVYDVCKKGIQSHRARLKPTSIRQESHPRQLLVYWQEPVRGISAHGDRHPGT